MPYLVQLLVAGLFGLGLLPVDQQGALQALLEPQLRAGRLQITVKEPADGRRFGGFDLIRIVVDDLDVRNIPIAAILPLELPRTPKGRIARLEFTATHARIDLTRASKITLLARDMTYDLPTAAGTQQLRMTTAAEETVSVVMQDGDLDAMAVAAFPELQSPHITFEDGKLVARAKVPLLFAAFNATIRGNVAIEGGSKVVLRQAELDTGRIQLAPALRESILKRLNPLLDLDKSLGFPVPVRWDRCAVSAGQVQLDGVVLPPSVPQEPTTFQPRERYLR